jgi:hypothetical protein
MITAKPPVPPMTPLQWAERYDALLERQRLNAARELATIDRLMPGYQQSEIEHNLQSHLSTIEELYDRKGRRALEGGFFSYEVRVDPAAAVDLVVAYWGGASTRAEFDVELDCEVVATQVIHLNQPGDFFEVKYSISPALTRGRSKATIRFLSRANSGVSAIFGLRVERTPLPLPSQ